MQINFGIINNLYKSSRKLESLSLTSTLIPYHHLNPGQANYFFPSDRLKYDLKYSDTSANEDNSFQNHIR